MTGPLAVVTGQHGFVGSHFRHWLERRGWEVVGCDLTDDHPYDCRDFFRNEPRRPDLLIHAAATIPSVDDRVANPLSVAEDFSLDAEMFQYVMRIRPAKTVYFSSSAAYPAILQNHTGRMALKEDHLTYDVCFQPDAMYGWTKIIGEMQAVEAQRAGLDVLIVRPFSGYGSDQSLNYPFPSFIDRAKRREDPFDVWGDGDQARDWVHIDDIVESVMVMLALDVQGPVNIGSGRAVSMLELAAMICTQAGYRPEFRTHPEKPIGTPYRLCDPTLFNRYYIPRVPLSEGIRRGLAE